MKKNDIKETINELYHTIKGHLDGLRLRDDKVNICSQIWFNHLSVGEQVDLMIDVKPSEIKHDMLHTCIYLMTSMIDENKVK